MRIKHTYTGFAVATACLTTIVAIVQAAQPGTPQLSVALQDPAIQSLDGSTLRVRLSLEDSGNSGKYALPVNLPEPAPPSAPQGYSFTLKSLIIKHDSTKTGELKGKETEPYPLPLDADTKDTVITLQAVATSKRQPKWLACFPV